VTSSIICLGSVSSFISSETGDNAGYPETRDNEGMVGDGKGLSKTIVLDAFFKAGYQNPHQWLNQHWDPYSTIINNKNFILRLFKQLLKMNA
jgi:hypothetical protein